MLIQGRRGFAQPTDRPVNCMSAPNHFNVRANGNGYLPSHRGSLSAFINKDKLTGPPHKPNSAWTTTFFVPIPGVPSRRFKVILPLPPFLGAMIRKRLARPKALLISVFIVVLVILNISVVYRKLDYEHRTGESWPQTVTKSITKTDTCVFAADQIRKFYEWEIWSGNHPSRRRSESRRNALLLPELITWLLVPARVGVPTALYNPSIPPASNFSTVSKSAPPYVVDGIDNVTISVGPLRIYIANEPQGHNVAYPPRPKVGSIADLDKIMQYCDFTTDQVSAHVVHWAGVLT